MAQPTPKTYNCDEHAAQFLLRLREVHHTSEVTCMYVAKGIQKLLEVAKTQIIDDVKSELEIQNLELGNANIFDRPVLEAKSFEKFSNTRTLNKYITNKFGVVHPVEEVLGINETSGKKETMQYIPVLKTLEQLLKHEDVLAEVLNGHKSNDGFLSDFCDGECYKNNPLFQGEQKNLQIQFYNDDFTTVNPLGSRAKNYKFSAFYYTLGNLRPKHRSKLHVIQLVGLCNSAYIKKYGYAAILQTFINDIKKLEDEGLDVEFEGRKFKFFGSISFVSADNLAAHALGRFPENFSSSFRLCRHCNATKYSIGNTLKENEFIPAQKKVMICRQLQLKSTQI